MFTNINELKKYLSDKRSNVMSVDVKCPRCHKISKKAGLFYADDVLDAGFTNLNFGERHSFSCTTCKSDVLYSIEDIRGIRKAGKLKDHILLHNPKLNIVEAELWENTVTNQYAMFTEPGIIQTTVSNPENSVFIPINNADDKTVKTYQAQLDNAIKLLEDEFLPVFYLNVLPEVEYYMPLSMNLDELDKAEQEGIVLYTKSGMFHLLQNRAKYVAIYNIAASRMHINDASHVDSWQNPAHYNYRYNQSYKIVVTEIAELLFFGSISPRRYYQIIQSDNTTLEGRFIEMTFNRALEEYEFSGFLDMLPTWIHESEPYLKTAVGINDKQTETHITKTFINVEKEEYKIQFVVQSDKALDDETIKEIENIELSIWVDPFSNHYSFDTKLSNGLWLENISYNNELSQATALIIQ